MKRIYFNKIMKGVAAAAVLFGAASCSDDLDYELFTKYTYLMNNGWQENIEMEINEDNTVDLPVYFGVNGTTGNSKDISLTLAVDEDTLADYNFDKNKYDEESYYLLLPEDCYAFDKTVYTIPAGSLNAGGVCQGGALFTLADLAFAAVANSRKNITLSLNAQITFLRAVSDGYIYAEATEVFSHAKVPFIEVRITDEQGGLLAFLTSSGYRKREEWQF